MSLIGDFQRESKKQNQRGRCLHYDRGTRCNNIISAHSIQKKGQLSLIAENGHVYCLSADLSILRKTDGKPLPKIIGINDASTFYGFCKHHDNELFKPIDDYPLTPDKKQIALYAYRCICKELFVKENAVVVLEKFINHPEVHPEMQVLLSNVHYGNRVGYTGLQWHKKLYDEAFLTEDYDQFEFLYVTCSTQCNAQFSGLLYPDFDFLGRELQDLSEVSRPLDLITFFTAPIKDGWAFGFAWHVSSNDTCIPFIQSLGHSVSIGQKPEDVILRFALSCCENHAIRISWWDELNEKQKQVALERMQMMADPTEPVPHNYLSSGCEGVANWAFEGIHTTLQIVSD
ncbi:hypothetical protein ACEUAM_06100 [Aeromonas hydrophila]|jgi:hypothetical protein|uniref:hypothetical protein n=1 Tax=Aeromonas hydrophila TaxID=644 RepID=UPI0038D0FE18